MLRFMASITDDLAKAHPTTVASTRLVTRGFVPGNFCVRLLHDALVISVLHSARKEYKSE